MKKINKRLDFLVVCFFVFLGPFLTVIVNLKPLEGGIISMLFPSIYLIVREKKNMKKIALAVLIFGGIFMGLFDFMETLNSAWVMERLVFSWRIFGVLPFDDVVGFSLMTLLVVTFYEHFIDDEKNKRISKNLMWALIPSAIVAVVFIIVSTFVVWEPFNIRYVYLFGGIVAIAVPLAVAYVKPKLITKLLSVSAFFFVVWFLAEIAAIKTGGLTFPGEYIGTVTVFGATFPFEELFFWMMMYAASVVSYYELFIDDLQ